MTPKDIKDQISHDPKLDHFMADFGDRLTDEYFMAMLTEGERQTLIDTRARLKERSVKTVVGERAINLEDDFLVPIQIRYKDPDDDTKAEGVPIRIIDESKLF